jgi:hypothetical protein
MKRYTRLRQVLLGTLLLSSGALGCAKSGASAQAVATEAAPAPPSAAPAPPPGSFGFASDGRMQAGILATTDAAVARSARPPRPESASEGRKIVRTGQLALSVDAFEPVREKIDALVQSAHAFVADSQVVHVQGRATEATIVLRVPTDGYESLVAALGKLGTIDNESSKADDVTDQWVDVTARLTNARKLEGRLIELAAKDAGNVSQLLEVESKLGEVREEIERYEGQLHVLDDQVSLSTLTLHVTTLAPYVAPVQPTFGGAAGRALAASWHDVCELARNLALGAVGALPWLPLGVAAFLGFRYARRRVRRALPAAAAKTTTGGGPNP